MGEGAWLNPVRMGGGGGALSSDNCDRLSHTSLWYMQDQIMDQDAIEAGGVDWSGQGIKRWQAVWLQSSCAVVNCSTASNPES